MPDRFAEGWALADALKAGGSDAAPEELALASHYVSTYCMHGAHRSCRLRCKTCGEPCRCTCGHPWARNEEADDAS